jgi:hypothetical protein
MKKTKNIKAKKILYYKRIIILGVIILLIGLILQAFFNLDSSIGSIFTSIGVAMLVIGIVRSIRRNQFPEKDERTRKIGSYALSYSWLFTLVLLTILFWLDHLKLVVFSTSALFSLIFFGMLVSANIFRCFLDKKGDI